MAEFAIVESGSITSMPRGNKGVKIGDYNYPPAAFTLWTEAERNAVGIYTVEIDNTNKKDEEWYINTDISYAFGSGKVKGTYGTATAKAIADANAKDSDGNELDPVVVVKGLKTIKKEIIDKQCAGILAPSDYMAIKAAEGIAIDSGWKTWRASVRTKCNSMQTQIDNAANVDALAALFTYTEQEDKSVTRPLGEFPIKE